jgi:hypothetical protein
MKQRNTRLEQRLVQNERIIQLLANKSVRDQDIVQFDTDFFELPQQNEKGKPFKQMTYTKISVSYYKARRWRG